MSPVPNIGMYRVIDRGNPDIIVDSLGATISFAAPSVRGVSVMGENADNTVGQGNFSLDRMPSRICGKISTNLDSSTPNGTYAGFMLGGLPDYATIHPSNDPIFGWIQGDEDYVSSRPFIAAAIVKTNDAGEWVTNHGLDVYGFDTNNPNFSPFFCYLVGGGMVGGNPVVPYGYLIPFYSIPSIPSIITNLEFKFDIRNDPYATEGNGNPSTLIVINDSFPYTVFTTDFTDVLGNRIWSPRWEGMADLIGASLIMSADAGDVSTAYFRELYMEQRPFK